MKLDEVPPRATECRICGNPIPQERMPSAVTCSVACQKQNRLALVAAANRRYYARKRARRETASE